MPNHEPSWLMLWLVGLTLSAAITDARKGLIPNCLTLPTLALVPLARGLVQGPGALGATLLGICACGAVPLWLFGQRAMGGGDVKLLAAVGALCGAHRGLELELLGFGLCAAVGMARLARERQLGVALQRALALGLAPLARSAPEPAGTPVRLGPPLFAAVLYLVVRAGLPV